MLGSRSYATRVRIEGRKNLESECTCPYWATCKHAVAVVLKYLEMIKAKTAIGRVEEDDPRLLELDAIEEEFDMEEYGEDLEEENVKARSASSRQTISSSLRAHRQKQTKAELVTLLAQLAKPHEGVRRLLEDRRTLTSGKTHKVLQAIRGEIAALKEPVWEGYGYGVPATSTERLEAALKTLVEAGQADAAVRLGPELLAAGSRVEELDRLEGGRRRIIAS